MRARDNPFAVHRVLQLRYRLTEEGWSRLLSRLESLRYRGAIVGREGRGKTTLLEDLAPRLESLRFRVRLGRVERGRRPFGDADWRLSRGLTQRDVVLLDSADELRLDSWLRWRWRTRRAGGLIVTSRRAGLLPTAWRGETTPALLEEMMLALAGVELSRSLPSPEALFARHRGNLRTALRELYDRCAGATEGTSAADGRPAGGVGVGYGAGSRSTSVGGSTGCHP